MNPTLILSIIAAYILLLFGIAHLTTRKVDSQSFYNGNRRSPWYIIAFGMLATSISGITFVSVPGMVMNSGFAYMQMVFGFIFGYIAVAAILLPLYYKLNLTTIYTYLKGRFGMQSYKTGASFFLLSRTLGSALRLFIVAIVLQTAVFDSWNIPFIATVSITMLLIFLYTRKGGIKTVIWTDVIQGIVFFGAIVLCLIHIKNVLDLDFMGMVRTIADSGIATTCGDKTLSTIYVGEAAHPRFFWKQFLAGIFTVIVMTGLDQDQMQKNLACRSLKDAQKNMLTYGVMFVPVNLLFLSLGVLLVVFAQQVGLNPFALSPDELFPTLATQADPATGELYLGTFVAILFILGIIAAAYSSADSAVTALTTSFTVDILGVKNDDPKLMKKRTIVHIGVSLVLIFVIVFFRYLSNDSVINAVYAIAGYTYGPLLGLFTFGLFTKYAVKDRYVLIVAVLSPILSYILNTYVHNFGFAILIVNGALCFIGLWLIRDKKTQKLVIS
ncbi:MAG: sodium:solute symporter [Bacteroidales bacterium]|nr:sodium:solute symporter [Bacteroidales bacterium]